MKKKFSTILMVIAAVFVVGFSSVYMAGEFVRVDNFSNMSDMWSLFVFNDTTGHALFHEVNMDDFVSAPFPVRGDSLLSVNGLLATQDNYFSLFGIDTPRGDRYEIEFSHLDSVFTTTIATHTIPAALQLQVWLMVILRALIVFGLISVALWGFIKQPYSSAVLTLSLFCLTMALQFTVAIGSIADVYASFQVPMSIVLLVYILSSFTAPLFLKLQLLFPARNPIYEKHRVIYNLLIFLPMLLLITIFSRFGHNDQFICSNILTTLMLVWGYVLLIRNYKKATVFLEKRQTRLVLLGAGPGLLMYVVFAWSMQFFGNSFISLPVVSRLLITNGIFLMILTIPVSLGYAFGKYRLLHVEGHLKRGTRFLAVNFFLLALFAGILWAVGELLLKNIGIISQTPILVLGILMAFFFMRIQRKIRHKIEEHFYPERAKLRVMMKDFLASSMIRTKSAQFWEELEDKLADGLSAEKIYPVLRVTGKDLFTVDPGEPAPFFPGDAFISRLESRDNPLLFDEMMASGKIVLSAEQKEWFIQRKSAILLPLVTSSGLLGFLVISCKTNGEDFTAEELELLESFSTQTALVAENLELLGERLEKEKLEEQLKVARNIQQGLLPGSIPDVPGIEMSALIRFCLDVAGDYYDIIPLEDGRIVLSIGDVSGKGVGAALLMANLQASLRTAQGMGATLAESAARINKLVFENTPSDMFITFFMICIDPVKKRMRYVNAGHNPPFLIENDGHESILSKGGLLFGVVEDAQYEEGETFLRSGDMILMYTDGVSEAMDSNDEEFGEKQIARIAARNRELPLDELLVLLEKEVSIFHGSGSYADDFTLLAARINAT
ncbi:MAG: SpoIIE family protein phosphatase [Candidatus Fermentibacteria bacterium]|nr:SpoIIE family protein phosphatase [Candidatus Fermentibacteria bacterium]